MIADDNKNGIYKNLLRLIEQIYTLTKRAQDRDKKTCGGEAEETRLIIGRETSNEPNKQYSKKGKKKINTGKGRLPPTNYKQAPAISVL